MDKLLFAAVADDDTGASDLAGMLAEQNLHTLLIIDLPSAEQFNEWSRGYQAIVMAEATRNLAPATAYERTLRAVEILQTRQPHLFQIKYCSTFDSTPAGNIGASIDAGLDALNENFTIAVPALPVNRRTTYQGYHFVHNQLISDSPMRQHPLTPMTNPNLVDLLGRQTKRRIGLAPYSEVEAGAKQLADCFQNLQREGVNIAIVDCLDDKHLETICRASGDLRLITGSSAFGMKLPAIWRERGLIEKRTKEFPALSLSANKYGCLFVAGSCSAATREQNEWLIERGVMAQHIHPPDLLSDDFDRTTLSARIRRELSAGGNFLLTTSSAANDVRRTQEWGAERALSVQALGESIAYALADLTLEIMREQPINGLIVAGGETSGAVCRRLEFGALQVGRNIEAGVPLCFSLGRFRIPVILKSGNFGSRDFYGKALQAVAHSDQYLF